jgi:hypothetical protein
LEKTPDFGLFLLPPLADRIRGARKSIVTVRVAMVTALQVIVASRKFIFAACKFFVGV